jgi:hypothetical protein
MKRIVIAATLLGALGIARAGDDPKRKLVVLEYRAGSSALVGIGTQVATTIGKQTSLQVLGPAQAKTMYGEQLEQTVVKCGGEADCVAKIGQKLGAADVILVGVSELGDVILTMQRIDVASHKVSARIADSLAGNTSPGAEQIDDYIGRLLPPSDFLRFGVIDIAVNQPGASITVGNERKGTSPLAPLTLHAPASYAIKVEKAGFVPFTTKVQLPPDANIKVEADLSRKSSRAWYQHWYVPVGLGLIVVAAAGTTIYFATGAGDSGLDFNGSVQ